MDIENKKILMGKVTPMELFEIRQKLLALDEKSGSPCAVKILLHLEKKGPLKIEDIEKSMKMTPDAIKMSMRKLKELSLISSNSQEMLLCYPVKPENSRYLKKEIRRLFHVEHPPSLQGKLYLY